MHAIRTHFKYRAIQKEPHEFRRIVSRYAIPTCNPRVAAKRRSNRRRLDELIDMKYYAHQDEF
ncbi:hypothetical protein QU481_14710 [Crenobacter sp. SG2303]|uniref:Uncharacterized protein n=1 Tax=Crenobacter oryzisoli TaxID=3056844 RepID=A0ABT7XQS1_9NEIS|nr:hypothetical protein [Crenobacter sp. SG2303]MDN0076139.1 hypothetical protein [Crenobacter sp. SG2303]